MRLSISHPPGPPHIGPRPPGPRHVARPERLHRWASSFALILLLAASACRLEGVTTPVEGPEEEEEEEEPGGYPALAWPLPGTDGADWVINNYVDLDPDVGALLDYRGGDKVLDGHLGVDIDVPNFRWMDDGFPVLAAAPGRVVGLGDGEFDRNVSCTGTWNYVEIEHENGSRATYGHLKNGSLAVALGEEVTSGQALGVVGSSGCSTQPHLHFELRDPAGAVVDPFLDELWTNPPVYDAPLTFMDLSVQAGAVAGVDDLKDPPANIDAISVGAVLGVGLSMAGGGSGDVVRVTLHGGDGGLEYDLSVEFVQVWRHTYWYWNRTVTANPGTWTLTVYTNDTPVATHEIDVS